MKIVTLAVLLTTSPAGATPILWQNIEAGMSAHTVRELYPAVKGKRHHRDKQVLLEDVQQVGKCWPEVTVHHPKGIVTKVEVDTLTQELWLKETCTKEAYQALLAKYGSAIDPAINASIDPETGKRVMTWIRGGVSIRFEFDPEGIKGWQITYEPVHDLGL